MRMQISFNFNAYLLLLLIPTLSINNNTQFEWHQQTNIQRNFFSKLIYDQMCIKPSKIQPSSHPYSSKLSFIFNSVFQDFLQGNFLNKRIGLDYFIDWKVYTYFATVLLIFGGCCYLLRLATNASHKNLVKFDHFLKKQNRKRIKQVSHRHIFFFSLAALSLILLNWAHQKCEIIEPLLKQTFCNIFSANSSKNSAHLLSIQGEQRASSQNDLVQYQLKLIKLLEQSQKFIRQKGLSQYINHLKQFKSELPASRILQQIEVEIAKYQFHVIDIRNYANSTTYLINRLRQQNLYNRIKLVSTFKQIDSFLKIEQIPSSIQQSLEVVIRASIIFFAVFIVVAILHFIKYQLRIHYLKMCLFALGILAFLFIIITLLLFIAENVICLGCTLKKQLQQKESFAELMHNKPPEEIRYYQMIFGYVQGTLETQDGISISKIIQQNQKLRIKIQKLISSDQFAYFANLIKQIFYSRNQSVQLSRQNRREIDFLRQTKLMTDYLKNFKITSENLLYRDKNRSILDYNLRQISDYLDLNENYLCKMNLHLIKYFQQFFFVLFILIILTFFTLNKINDASMNAKDMRTSRRRGEINLKSKRIAWNRVDLSSFMISIKIIHLSIFSRQFCTSQY